VALWWVSRLGVAQAGPVVTDEFGDDDSTNIADWSYKLDAIEVHSTVRLISISPRVVYSPFGFNGADELYFVVYEETAPDEWSLLWDSGLEAVGSLPGFKESPEIDIVLNPGQRYAMGAYFPDGNYEYGVEDPANLVDHGWAELVGSIWSSEDTTYSLPNSITASPDEHAYLMRITVEILDVDGDGVLTEDDCDDEDAQTYPGAPELCDGLDNDCTGAPDDPVDHWYWYRDEDGDGYGDPSTEFDLCTGESPEPGWTELGDDCDDADSARYPGALEYCDAIDNDCSGVVDDNLAYTDGWTDSDGDGYGDPGAPTSWCEPERPAGFSDNDFDCDDTDALAFPGADEICDGADDNCDGLIDEGLPTTTIWRDADGDGHGDLAQPFEWCEVLPEDGSTLSDDCDDSDATRFPGNEEICDGVDNDCDEQAPDEQDLDGDQFLACEDCADDDATVFPGAEEVCDGLDHDCDGVIPERLDCDPAPDEKLSVAGCSCATGATPGSLAGMGLLLLAVVARRRP
jgi:MYXO-CTERM domain-containing protein